jgi:hypothetical protein
MTRDEIESLLTYAHDDMGRGVKVGEIDLLQLAELCRLALIGEPIDRREREIAAALDEIAAEGQACDAVIDCKQKG